MRLLCAPKIYILEETVLHGPFCNGAQILALVLCSVPEVVVVGRGGERRICIAHQALSDPVEAV